MPKELTVNLKVEDIFAKMEKRTKGYGFDSLVFRYKMAREAEARYEYREALRNNTRTHDEQYYLDKANRDAMRFIQILDDLIGEHD